MATYILLSLLLFELLVETKLLKFKISSPPVLFVLGFLISSIILSTMSDFWNVNLGFDTIMLISLGSFFFLLGSCVCVSITQQRHNSPRLNNTEINQKRLQWFERIRQITHKKKLVWVFIIFNILSVAAYVYFKLQIAYSYGASGELLYLMAYVSDLEKLMAVQIEINSIVTLCFAICRYSGYIWGMLFIDVFFAENKMDKRLLICFAVSLFAWFMTGSRGDGISMILGVIIYGILKNSQYKKFKFRLRTVILCGFLIVAFIFLFDFYARITNRIEDDYDLWEYISIYVGAPLLNLDYMLKHNIEHSSVFGEKTFGGIYKMISSKLGIDIVPKSTYASLASEYRAYRGHTLGNVYTIYRPLLIDFGWIGTLITIFIMGFVCQSLYEEARKIYHKKSISVKTLMYIFLSSSILFSFFSNKICGTVLSADFFHGFLAWLLIIYALKHVKVGNDTIVKQ